MEKTTEDAANLANATNELAVPPKKKTVIVDREALEELLAELWMLKGKNALEASSIAALQADTLNVVTSPAHAEAIRVLDTMIGFVLSGDIVSFGIAMVHKNFNTGFMYHRDPTQHPVGLIGSIELMGTRLKHGYLTTGI